MSIPYLVSIIEKKNSNFWKFIKIGNLSNDNWCIEHNMRVGAPNATINILCSKTKSKKTNLKLCKHIQWWLQQVIST